MTLPPIKSQHESWCAEDHELDIDDNYCTSKRLRLTMAREAGAQVYMSDGTLTHEPMVFGLDQLEDGISLAEVGRLVGTLLEFLNAAALSRRDDT